MRYFAAPTAWDPIQKPAPMLSIPVAVSLFAENECLLFGTMLQKQQASVPA